VGKYGRARHATDDNIIRRMGLACWITKATDTHSEYVILIASPRQQWLRERTAMLRYMYIVFFNLIEFYNNMRQTCVPTHATGLENCFEIIT
jgi:hypothetical protein